MPQDELGHHIGPRTFRRNRNAHVKHSVNALKLLIITALLSTESTFLAKCQKTNELVYDSLILAHPELITPEVTSISGIVTEGLASKIETGDTGNLKLTLTPEVIWRKKKKMFERSIEVRLAYDDSLMTEVVLSYNDLVHPKDVRRLRKTKHSSLKGENPSTLHRIAIPVTAIVAGTVGMISLFYIRSN